MALVEASDVNVIQAVSELKAIGSEASPEMCSNLVDKSAGDEPDPTSTQSY